MHKSIVVLLLVLMASQVKAQKVISLDDAIAMALKNNYGIKMSANNIKMAENSSTKGNAGLLPHISAEGNSGISSVNEKGVAKTTNTFNLGAGINLNFPIYDGGAGRHRYRLLQMQSEQAELQHRQQVQNTLMEVIRAYLSTANVLESVSAQKKSLEISDERLKRIKVENEFGNNTSLDVLNAQVDFNKDSVTLMNLSHDYTAKKLGLVELISEKWLADDFDVQTQINGLAIFKLDSLISQAKTNNLLLLNKRNMLEQSNKNLQIAKSEFMPKLSLQSGYNYNSINAAFYSPKSHRGQFTSGLKLTIPIFNGGQRKTKLANARLQAYNQEFEVKQNELQIEKQVRLIYQSYQNQLKNIAIETGNLKAVERNLALSKELLQNGQITNTQFREAQQNLLLAETNITRAKFNVKILEYNILMLTGQLIDYIN